MTAGKERRSPTEERRYPEGLTHADTVYQVPTVTAGFRAVRWAKRVPVVRRADGRPDHVAHHVLLVLATFADASGQARPSITTLADECYLTDSTVRRGLMALQASGLIIAAGDWAGTTVWKLAVSTPAEPRERDQDERRRRACDKHAKRQQRYRDRLSRDAVARRHIEDSDGVGHRHVTLSHGVSDGVGHRHVTLSPPSQPQVRPPVTASRTANELPLELPVETGPRRARAKIDYSDAFTAFWEAYPLKAGKDAAARAYAKAIKKTPPAVILEGARRYAATRAGEDPHYTKHAQGWLTDARWTDEAPATPSRNGHQPYRNPVDQSVYDEPL